MKQKPITVEIIKEYSDRSKEISHDLQIFLTGFANVYTFTWTAPVHDIARRIMNQIQEFKPAADDEP